jgi:nucleotide-binding universal stress UspA family protein
MAEPSLLLAMVLLAAPAAPTVPQVEPALAAHGVQGTVAAEKADALAIDFGGEVGIITMLMPGPVPREEVVDAAEHNLLWEDGPAVVARHQAHLVVVGYGDHSGVADVIRFGRTVAAVADASDALAVYWGSGSIAVEAGAFSAAMKAATPDDLPLEAWIGVDLARNRKGHLSILTFGMALLPGRNVWLQVADPERQVDALGFALDLCRYQAHTGAVIRPGETVGGSAEERLKVKLRKTPIPGDRNKVLHLRY